MTIQSSSSRKLAARRLFLGSRDQARTDITGSGRPITLAHCHSLPLSISDWQCPTVRYCCKVRLSEMSDCQTVCLRACQNIRLLDGHMYHCQAVLFPHPVRQSDSLIPKAGVSRVSHRWGWSLLRHSAVSVHALVSNRTLRGLRWLDRLLQKPPATGPSSLCLCVNTL